MPDPKDNAKLTGDTHPPEVESELMQEGMSEDIGADGTPRERGQASEQRRKAKQQKTGRGNRDPGLVRDRDEPEPKDESRLG